MTRMPAGLCGAAAAAAAAAAGVPCTAHECSRWALGGGCTGCAAASDAPASPQPAGQSLCRICHSASWSAARPSMFATADVGSLD
jgi:hypothetical protein